MQEVSKACQKNNNGGHIEKITVGCQFHNFDGLVFFLIKINLNL